MQGDEATVGVFGSGARLGSAGAMRIVDGLAGVLMRAV